MPADRAEQPVQEFAAFTADLYRLAEWLSECGVETVVMESTGVYWIPLFGVLEERGFQVMLVDPRRIKNVAWSQDRRAGLPVAAAAAHLRPAVGAFRPDGEIRRLRSYLRQRTMLVMVQRRIRAARFPAVKSLDTFDFLAIPSLNKPLVMQLARCEYIERSENVIAIGNSGTGKTHVALGLGLAACQRGMSVGFTTAAALVHELMEARDDRRLLNLQRQLARLNLLIIDELGFVPLSTTGAELLFEVFSQRYERGSILVTTNLPFDEWT